LESASPIISEIYSSKKAAQAAFFEFNLIAKGDSNSEL
jgi:hypothetical protein